MMSLTPGASICGYCGYTYFKALSTTKLSNLEPKFQNEVISNYTTEQFVITQLIRWRT
jgi:hypothetical protein